MAKITEKKAQEFLAATIRAVYADRTPPLVAFGKLRVNVNGFWSDDDFHNALTAAAADRDLSEQAITVCVRGYRLGAEAESVWLAAEELKNELGKSTGSNRTTLANAIAKRVLDTTERTVTPDIIDAVRSTTKRVVLTDKAFNALAKVPDQGTKELANLVAAMGGDDKEWKVEERAKVAELLASLKVAIAALK